MDRVMSLDLTFLHNSLPKQPYALLFATLSGAHLYGFPSPDSDYDVRGVHVLPLDEVVGLQTGPETVELSTDLSIGPLDLVTHDVAKFLRLLLRPNGYVLEQLLSPLVLQETNAFQELKALAPGCITRHHAHHYLGFAATQWNLFQKERPLRIKPLLYVYRVLLTGIHLMRTGKVEANLVYLQQEAHLPYVDALLYRKQNEAEKATLAEEELAHHVPAYALLRTQLQEAYEHSTLPDKSTSREALHNLLIRVRRDHL